MNLQEAREQAKARYVEIAAQETPPQVRVVVPRKSLTGLATRAPLAAGGWTYIIAAPRPFTRKALYIYLHECAHIALGHLESRRKPRHREELEAELWAHERMRAHGVPVPSAMTERARRHVARKIAQAKKRGALNIDRDAERFAAKPGRPRK